MHHCLSRSRIACLSFFKGFFANLCCWAMKSFLVLLFFPKKSHFQVINWLILGFFSDSLILKIFHFPTNPYSTLSSQPSGYKNRSKLACLLGILIPPPTTYLSSPQKNPKTSKTEFSLDDKPRRKREITIFAIDLILCPLIFGILSPSFF